MHSRKTPWRLIALISLIVVIAAWSLAFWQSRQVERRLFADTGRRMQTIAETHAAQAALSLAIADESLKRLQDTLRRDGEAAFGRVGSNMSLPESAGGAINRVALIGKNGRMTQNFLNGESVVLLDVSDREYFKTFRDDPRDRIFLPNPSAARPPVSGSFFSPAPSSRTDSSPGSSLSASALANLQNW